MITFPQLRSAFPYGPPKSTAEQIGPSITNMLGDILSAIDKAKKRKAEESFLSGIGQAPDVEAFLGQQQDQRNQKQSFLGSIADVFNPTTPSRNMSRSEMGMRQNMLGQMFVDPMKQQMAEQNLRNAQLLGLQREQRLSGGDMGSTDTTDNADTLPPKSSKNQTNAEDLFDQVMKKQHMPKRQGAIFDHAYGKIAYDMGKQTFIMEYAEDTGATPEQAGQVFDAIWQSRYQAEQGDWWRNYDYSPTAQQGPLAQIAGPLAPNTPASPAQSGGALAPTVDPVQAKVDEALPLKPEELSQVDVSNLTPDQQQDFVRRYREATQNNQPNVNSQPSPNTFNANLLGMMHLPY